MFAIRHGLALRGWSMLGKSSGVRVGALFVKALDLSQAKNSVDAFKVAPHQRSAEATFECSAERLIVGEGEGGN